MKTGQKLNSLPEVQIPMKNCTNIQCFILYMVGKINKSTFQRNKLHVIWTFQQRVMTELVDTAQKANSQARLHEIRVRGDF